MALRKYDNNPAHDAYSGVCRGFVAPAPPPPISCGVDEYQLADAAHFCIPCSNTKCADKHVRKGYCGGTVNAYSCDLVPNTLCPANQYRFGEHPGACMTCSNVECPVAHTREGTCTGAYNGFVCRAIPNVVCPSDQVRVGSN